MMASALMFGQGISAYAGYNGTGVTVENELAGASDPEGEAGINLGVSYDLDLWIFYLNAGAQYTTSKFKFADQTEELEVIRERVTTQYNALFGKCGTS